MAATRVGSEAGTYTEELLEELQVEQRRAANYLAFFAWITAIAIVLGVGSGVVWYLATR